MVDVFVWLLVGGVVGWMTSAIMHPIGPRGHALNVCVGMVGAALGGWLIPPLIGVGPTGQGVLNLGALLVALVAAILLLAIANLFQREDDEANPNASAVSDEP
ncbi:GlsB/YeaQ/YmgE family stress response membrane protein [Hydrogenophaga sp. 2FB]|uniref:GlsB/YeaQ/YmgE family stress response membrane protein n=1 Tax=Hydrogenophaga sp. 2FB TaxID=2502187 RepID=UPI00207BB47D|nr:GlsB/YeaQ/YmgE family stress response membrane protein [Hydrogenophaga sp. 2FB]